MQIELEFHLDEPVDGPLIQYSLCNVNGEVVFGTNSELLSTTLPRLAPGRYVYRIISTLIYSASKLFAIRWPGVP